MLEMIHKVKCKATNTTVSFFDNEKTKSNKSIVFLHGNSLSKSIFMPVIHKMDSLDVRIVALDFPGHGESEFLSDYSIKRLSEVVSELSILLDLEKPYIVGHSLGGHVAIHVVHRIAASGVLLYSTPLIDKIDDFGVAYKNPRALELFGKSKLTEDEAKELCLLVGTPEGWKDLLKVDENFRTSLVESIVNEGDPQEAKKWHAIQVPKKIFVGIDDSLVNVDFVQSVGKAGEVIGVNETFSHTPFVVNPEIVFNQIKEFI